MNQKAVIIYNPTAGTTNRQAQLQEVADWWTAQGWATELRPTSRAGHATELARQAVANGVQLILSAGGDGTLSEVCNGVIHTNAIVGVLPSGTGNSFAKELQMSRPSVRPNKALIHASKQLLDGTIHKIDMLDWGNQYGLLWIGVGTESYLIEKMEPRPPLLKKFGIVGYLVQGILHLATLPKWETYIEIDGQPISGKYGMVVVSNGRLYAGGEVTLAPHAVLDDGKLELTLFQSTSIVRMLQFLCQARYGRHLTNPHAVQYQVQHLAITTTPHIPKHVDGDHAGNCPITCKVAKQAINLLIPSTAPANLFQNEGVPLHCL